jgi:DNA invertase Pin-like site-specific DNA recombinase
MLPASAIRRYAATKICFMCVFSDLADHDRQHARSIAAQVAALGAAGAGKVFREVARGARTNRLQLRKAIASLGAGDLLMVTRLDRLARSTRDLLNTLAAITDRKAGFRSLSDAWADTTTSHGRLMLTVLGGLAEFERDLIRARTSEGRERARARGVRMGRPPKLTPHQRREALRRRNRGTETLADSLRKRSFQTGTHAHAFPGRSGFHKPVPKSR